VARALAKTPADRYATAAQFAEALSGRGPARGRQWARVGGLAALAGIVVAGVWVGVDRAGDDARAAITRRPYTIVAEVEGSADPEIRNAMRRLLMDALDQSKVVVTLDDEQLRRGLELAGKPAAVRLDRPTARELAVRGSIRTVVIVAVDRVGQAFRVSVRVLDAENGAPVVVEQGVATDSNHVIQTVDAVVRAVREGLGERRDAIAVNRPLLEAATGSFEAYRKYARGRELFMAGDFRASVPLFQEAIALDPDFGEAWRSLGVAYNALGVGDSARLAIFEAFTRGTGMTDVQRLTTEGFVAGYRGDLTAAVAAQERAVREFGSGPTNLANTLVQVDRTAEAVALTEAWVRGAPFGPRQPDVINLAAWLPMLGRYDEARKWAVQVRGLGALRFLTWVAAAEGDWVAAESLAVRLLKDPSASRPQRMYALSALASSHAARGKVHAADENLRESLASGAARAGYRALLTLSVSAGTPLSPGTLATLGSDTSAAGRTIAALWAAGVGDTGAARRYLLAVRKMPAEARQAGRVEGELALVEAWIAASGHRWEEVVRLLGPLAGRTYWGSPSNQLTRWTLADAYAHIGRLDSAAVLLEDIANWRRFSELDQHRRGLTESFAHRRLVLLYAKMGRLDDARRHWKAFSETFTNPDPEMLPLIQEAREALDRAERAGR
jgi:tetratricopeptide (TPR) repeat protein